VINSAGVRRFREEQFAKSQRVLTKSNRRVLPYRFVYPKLANKWSPTRSDVIARCLAAVLAANWCVRSI
jgi:hypothetical protein